MDELFDYVSKAERCDAQDKESNGWREVVFGCFLVLVKNKEQGGRSTDKVELRRGWVYVSQT